MGCNPKRNERPVNQEKLSRVQYDAIIENILLHRPSTKTMQNTANSRKEISTSNGMLRTTFQCRRGRLPWQVGDAKSPPEAMSTSDYTSSLSLSTSDHTSEISWSTSDYTSQTSRSTSEHTSHRSQSTSYGTRFQVTVHVIESTNAEMAAVALPAQKIMTWRPCALHVSFCAV